MNNGKSNWVFCKNSKATHDYFVEDSIEAGIELCGCEVKSIRAGRCNLKGSYATVRNGEVYLLGCHISEYDNSGYATFEPDRERKLLLHKKEINKLAGVLSEKGITLFVRKLYSNGNKIKAELCVGRGKHHYDKRRSEAEKDAKRKIEQSMKVSFR